MVVAARQLLNDDVKGERVWYVERYLLHLFLSLRFVVLGQAQLAELVAAPGEKLSVFEP